MHVINFLLFLFHSKFQKVKIAFLYNIIQSQHNYDRLKGVTSRLYYILHGWIKGTKCMCMQLTIRIIFILECVNNNKDTRLWDLT